MPVLPGCANPTDIETALSLGLETVKFFPAEALGGLKMIKALAGPYPNVRFVPTGGINEKNLVEYLSFPKVDACGGSWMAPDDAVAAQDWPRICALASAAVRNLLHMKLAHVAINCADDGEARGIANMLCAILGGAPEERAKSFFATPDFEIMKYDGRGTKGHIAISTPMWRRAIWHMRRRGFEFDFRMQHTRRMAAPSSCISRRKSAASRCICCWRSDGCGPWRDGGSRQGLFEDAHRKRSVETGCWNGGR